MPMVGAAFSSYSVTRCFCLYHRGGPAKHPQDWLFRHLLANEEPACHRVSTPPKQYQMHKPVQIAGKPCRTRIPLKFVRYNLAIEYIHLIAYIYVKPTYWEEQRDMALSGS